MATQAQNAKRRQDFICMLYPDFDENHRKFIKYVENHPSVYQCAYIRHDKDVWGEKDAEVLEGAHKAGEPKKAHTHFLLHCKNRTTKDSITKFFEGWVAHFEECASVEGTLLYFVHDTPNSCHKAQYDPSEIRGEPELISKAFDKTRILSNLQYFAEASKNNMRLADILADIASHDDATAQVLLKTLTKYSHLIVSMNNQELNYARELVKSYDSLSATKQWMLSREKLFKEIDTRRNDK